MSNEIKLSIIVPYHNEDDSIIFPLFNSLNNQIDINFDDIKYTYTSQAIEPNFNVIVTFSGGRTVKLNENEYEVSYNNNINVGVGNISLKILENSTNFPSGVVPTLVSILRILA